jgi:hypothetical protein
MVVRMIARPIDLSMSKCGVEESVRISRANFLFRGRNPHGFLYSRNNGRNPHGFLYSRNNARLPVDSGSFFLW